MIQNTPKAWDERALSAQTSHEAALWSEQGQRDRMVAVVKALDPQRGDRLLDFGCGTGKLIDYLPDGVEYVGHDWSLAMLVRAKTDHPGHQFTASEPMGRFDLIACIGTFNLADNWSKEKTWETLRILWEQNTPRALAVSLYAGDDPNCLRYEGREVFKAALNVITSGRTTVIEHRTNDLLLVLER